MKINYIMASLAVIGGISAVFTNHAEKNNFYPTWKFEKERIEGERIRYISAPYLAELLYKKEQGIVILDFRNKEDYIRYHIPTANHYETGGALGNTDPEKQVVVYGLVAGQLSVEQVNDLPGKVYVLKGGIEQWYELVLFPDFDYYKVRNSHTLHQIILRSRFFGGTPRNLQQLHIEVRKSRFREGC